MVKGVIGADASAMVGGAVHGAAQKVNAGHAPPTDHAPTTSEVLAPPGSKRAAVKGFFKGLAHGGGGGAPPAGGVA